MHVAGLAPCGTRPVMRLFRLLLIAVCCAAASSARAELRDDFNGGDPSWRDAGGQASYKILRRERRSTNPVGGAEPRFEFWELAVEGGGTTIYLSYDVGQAPIIDETAVELTVLGERPGMQLAVRVVFPRTLEPQTGKPVTALIAGDPYTTPGQWQKLSIAGLREQTEQQVRVLRAQLRMPVDSTQAYIDRVLLNAYSGPGLTRVSIDHLYVAGIVNRMLVSDAQPGAQPPIEATPSPAVTRSVQNAIVEQPSGTPIEMKGQTLQVGGRPFFPRVLEYRGEPLALVQKLGFNAVKLRSPPPPELMAEAKRLGLWIVCPPPAPPDLNNPYGNAAGANSAQFAPWADSVLVWDVGDGWTGSDVDAARRWAEYVRRGDQPRPRPIIGGAAADLRTLSRQVDFVTLDRRPIGTDCEISRYGDWIRERARITRPGTPLWAVIQTEPLQELEEQAKLLGTTAVGSPLEVDAEQIRLLAYEALAAGVRGLVFSSRTSLADTNEATRVRAATLHQLNLELELIDVWASAGNFVATVPGSEPDLSAALFQIDRGHLLLPMWSGQGAQYVPGQSSGVNVSFVVPGIPEAVDVYEIAPGGLRPLVRKRVAGGMKVTLDELNLTSLILLTQDPQVVGVCAHRLSLVGPTLAEQVRETTIAKFQRAQDVHTRLVAFAPRVPEADLWLTASARALERAESRMSEGNIRDGYFETCRALRPLAALERMHWKNAVKEAGSTHAFPFTTSFAALPDFWRMYGRLQQPTRWENVLPGGDFEDLESLLAAGWRHYQAPAPGVRCEADLSGRVRTAAAPLQVGSIPDGSFQRPQRTGRFCLRLAATATEAGAAEALVETPPVWITSPAVPVGAGQLLRISGWINVPQKIAGSGDGLVVFDSIGGAATAIHFDKPGAWQPFTFYRLAPLDGSVSLTAALSGLGEAYLDDVKIEAVR